MPIDFNNGNHYTIIVVSILKAASFMDKLKRIFTLPWIPRNALRLIIKQPCILFRSFPYTIFYQSIFYSILATLILVPFAARLDKSHIFQLFSPIQITNLEKASRSIYLDPFLIHIITCIFIGWLLYKIAMVELLNVPHKTLCVIIISISPLILLGASYLFSALIFKPAFAFPRPVDYLTENEPPIVKLFYKYFGPGDSAPSGFVVRQMVLMLSVFLINRYETNPLKKKKFWVYLTNIVAFLFVILVGALRLCVGAHTIFDFSLSIGCGAMIFWLIYIIPYSLYNQNGATRTVCVLYTLFAGVFVFYTKNPKYWIISYFLTTSILMLIDIIPEILMKIRNSNTVAQ
jgi:hypothetical protein